MSPLWSSTASRPREWGWSPSGLSIVELCVAPAFRGRGLGRRLLTDLCSAADITGLAVKLTVDAENAVARHLYESLGFHVSVDQVHMNDFSVVMTRTPQVIPEEMKTL